jgi:hypothetical protein
VGDATHRNRTETFARALSRKLRVTELTGDEIASLWQKARAWEVEASIAPLHMRAIYQRMADACVQLAREGVAVPTGPPA